MLNCNCQCRCNCTLGAIVASVILGIVTAFLHITGIVTATPIFLWGTLGISVIYLAILLLRTGTCLNEGCSCICSTISTLLVGILGSVLLSVILFAIGITATSVLSAILVGLLVLFQSLIFTSTACFIRSGFGCGD